MISCHLEHMDMYQASLQWLHRHFWLEMLTNISCKPVVRSVAWHHYLSKTFLILTFGTTGFLKQIVSSGFKQHLWQLVMIAAILNCAFAVLSFAIEDTSWCMDFRTTSFPMHCALPNTPTCRTSMGMLRT